MESIPLGSVLVIGGCGFLGHHIVQQLVSESSTTVSVLDLRTTRNRVSGVTYYDGDITSESSVRDVLAKAKPQVIIHTASPVAAGANISHAIFDRVNIGGTENLLLRAAECPSVKAFVYTSSGSVIHPGPTVDVVGIDESAPVILAPEQTEYYSHTKGVAEKAVLAANRSATTRPDFLTCAIRPAGIFGEGDVQAIPGLLTAYFSGKVRFQIGNNENLFDWTYVGNVAHGHILAAKALVATSGMGTRPLDHEKVDGEAFFITNDSPMCWWDFARGVWRAAGDRTPLKSIWVLNRDFMLVVAHLAEWMYWILFQGRRKPNLAVLNVKYSTMTRWYNIDKAKKRLGYKPRVDIPEAITRSVDWALKNREKQIAEAAGVSEKEVEKRVQ